MSIVEIGALTSVLLFNHTNGSVGRWSAQSGSDFSNFFKIIFIYIPSYRKLSNFTETSGVSGKQ